jgi:ferric-dicitrate binding protein FerR (iron transport regulator)
VEQKEIKKLLDKFNNGKCSAEELGLLQALMHDLDTDEEAEKPSAELKQSLWEQIEKRTSPARRVRPLYTTWLKIAAVLLISIFAGIFASRIFISHKTSNAIVYQVITAPKGQMRQVVLPDSTVVQLNAGSSIKFPIQFSEKKREVFLLDGEAFFDVKHYAAKPFLVHAANVTTQVLGTSFNIKYYKELPHIQVFVNSGKVEVHDQKHTLGMYTAHEQLTYNKQNESFIKQQVADEHSLSWMHDELILNDVSFKEVVVYLQNRYSVSFQCSSKKLNQQHYSVRFSNKLTINQVIDILQLIDGRKYKLQGNTVNIN